jgi:Flp pilus assembly protein TadG
MRNTLGHGERGQALVLVALSMVVMVGMGALGVDIANWYQARHRAQVAADAAALAAANCMAHEGITRSASTPVCTTTSDAQTVATNYAAINGVSIPLRDVTFNSSTVVSVTTPNQTPSVLSGIFGIHTAQPTGVAAAKWTSVDTNSCSTPDQSNGSCFMMFARDTNCADNAISITHNGNANITGGIWSDGSYQLSNTGNAHFNSVVYGDGSGCGYNFSGNHNVTYGSGPSPKPPLLTWPRDWSKVITACGGTGNPCGASGTPSFCTQSAANFTLAPPGNQVYCAYGTGTLSDPSTWNGQINVTGNGAVTASFIAGYVSLNLGPGASSVTAALTSTLGSLLIYANGGDSSSPISCTVSAKCAAEVQKQSNVSFTGDVFVPNGTADIDSQGNGMLTTFIEAQDIAVIAGGGITGDGPSAGFGGTPLPGTDVLVQ